MSRTSLTLKVLWEDWRQWDYRAKKLAEARAMAKEGSGRIDRTVRVVESETRQLLAEIIYHAKRF